MYKYVFIKIKFININHLFFFCSVKGKPERIVCFVCMLYTSEGCVFAKEILYIYL